MKRSFFALAVVLLISAHGAVSAEPTVRIEESKPSGDSNVDRCVTGQRVESERALENDPAIARFLLEHRLAIRIVPREAKIPQLTSSWTTDADGKSMLELEVRPAVSQGCSVVLLNSIRAQILLPRI